jgi:maltose-binding protein MalE
MKKSFSIFLAVLMILSFVMTVGAEDGPTLTIWADDTRSEILSALGDDFYNAYGVKVVVEEIADIRDNFTVAAPEGEGPDIFIGAHDWLGQVAASGLVAPLELGDLTASFSQPSLDGCSYEGVLYCMPYAVENLAFFYNTDIVSTPPATWDEAMQIGADFKAAYTGEEEAYAIALSGTSYDIYPLETSFGGYIFGMNEDGSYNAKDLGLNSDGMVAALSFIVDNVNAGLIPATTDWDTAHVIFETGRAPFLMAGPWALDRVRESGIPFAITTFPAGTQEGYPFLGVQGFYVNALSDNVLLAQAFLTEFVAKDDVMLQLQAAGNRASAMPAIAAQMTDADLATFGEVGVTAKPMPSIPEMGSVWGSWGDATTLAMQGEVTAAQALSDAYDQVMSLFAGAMDGMVNVPGSWQVAGAGCDADWSPSCEASALTMDGDVYVGTFDIPAGDYEVKVAMNGSWDLNYGVDGVEGGDNYAFTSTGTVTFTFDPATNLLTIE